MPHEEEREARAEHSRTISLLRDLRGDADYRLVAILQDQDNRTPDDLSEVRRQREWIRGELDALQRRIEQTINYLR